MRIESPDPFVPVVTAAAVLEGLFDRLPDVVFFLKDRQSRYRLVNRTLVMRCGLEDKDELIGRTTVEVFPQPLGDRYLRQDRGVCEDGMPLSGRLELHLYPNRREGWCLTDKVPLKDATGRVIGLAGVSRDLRLPADAAGGQTEVANAVALLQERFAEDLTVEQLAAGAGLSAYQLNRRVRAIFGITAGQLITTTRIEAASRLLRSTERAVADIAAACGYCDQSAFSRQFKAVVGLTPSQYRARHS